MAITLKGEVTLRGSLHQSAVLDCQRRGRGLVITGIVTLLGLRVRNCQSMCESDGCAADFDAHKPEYGLPGSGGGVLVLSAKKQQVGAPPECVDQRC